MFSKKQDWLERQIETISLALTRLFWDDKKIRSIIDKLEETRHANRQDDELNDIVLETIIKNYLAENKFPEAKEVLSADIKKGKTAVNLIMSLKLYDELLKLSEEELIKYNFSKEKINSELKKLAEFYEK